MEAKPVPAAAPPQANPVTPTPAPTQPAPPQESKVEQQETAPKPATNGVDQNSVIFLKSIKELNAVKARLDYLETMHSQALEHETRLYHSLGYAEAKIRWRMDIDERTNPVDLTFFLNEQKENFFDPAQFKQADSCMTELGQVKESIVKIEQEERELRIKLKQLMPSEPSIDFKGKSKAKPVTK